MNEFDQFFSGNLSDTEGDNQGKEWFAPTMDIHETDKEYLFTFDLPGMKEKDLTIQLDGRVLTVTGERKRESPVEAKNHRTERSFGRFERRLTLPENINPEAIEAVFKEGVLDVRVAKKEIAQPKKIAIKPH